MLNMNNTYTHTNLRNHLHANLRTAQMCIDVHNSRTQHSTEQFWMIIRLILRAIITAQMQSAGGEGAVFYINDDINIACDQKCYVYISSIQSLTFVILTSGQRAAAIDRQDRQIDGRTDGRTDGHWIVT